MMVTLTRLLADSDSDWFRVITRLGWLSGCCIQDRTQCSRPAEARREPRLLPQLELGADPYIV